MKPASHPSSASRRIVLFGILVAGAASLLPSSTFAADDLLVRVREAGVLRVANTQGHAPWDFLDETNTLTGFGVEMARELARRMGVQQVEFIPARFADLIPGVEAGRFDLVIAGHTITDERKKIVDFSTPYMVVGTSVFARKDDASISRIEDLEGKTIGVLAGSVQEDFLNTTFPGRVTVKTYENPTQALSDLAIGRSDGVIYSNDAGAFIALKNKLDVASGLQLDREVNGMLFAKNNPSFKAELDKAFQSMLEDGTISALSRKWLGSIDMAALLRELPR